METKPKHFFFNNKLKFLETENKIKNLIESVSDLTGCEDL